MQFQDVSNILIGIRPRLCTALGAGDSSASLLLKSLAREFRFQNLLEQPAGILEGWRVGEHHLMALTQQKKYRLGSHSPLPDSPASPRIGERGIILALSVHDLDKYRIGETKCKDAEHSRTLAAIERNPQLFPLSPTQFRTLCSLVGNNILGELLRRVVEIVPPKDEKLAALDSTRRGALSIDQYHQLIDRWERLVVSTQRAPSLINFMIRACARSFVDRGRTLGINPSELLQLQTAFFQADISSYTWDTNVSNLQGTPSLDYLLRRNRAQGAARLFIRNELEDRLYFSDFYEATYLRLRDTVADMANSSDVG